MSSVVDLDAALRGGGHRVTGARRVVWSVLTTSDDHPTAADIAERARRVDPGINTSSVYRTLAILAELDLVRESRLADTATSRWEVVHRDAVIHLVCERCGAVQHHRADAVDELRRQLARNPGFQADAIDVRATGICRRCRWSRD